MGQQSLLEGSIPFGRTEVAVSRQHLQGTSADVSSTQGHEEGRKAFLAMFDSSFIHLSENRLLPSDEVTEIDLARWMRSYTQKGVPVARESIELANSIPLPAPPKEDSNQTRLRTSRHHEGVELFSPRAEHERQREEKETSDNKRVPEDMNRWMQRVALPEPLINNSFLHRDLVGSGGSAATSPLSTWQWNSKPPSVPGPPSTGTAPPTYSRVEISSVPQTYHHESHLFSSRAMTETIEEGTLTPGGSNTSYAFRAWLRRCSLRPETVERLTSAEELVDALLPVSRDGVWPQASWQM